MSYKVTLRHTLWSSDQEGRIVCYGFIVGYSVNVISYNKTITKLRVIKMVSLICKKSGQTQYCDVTTKTEWKQALISISLDSASLPSQTTHQL